MFSNLKDSEYYSVAARIKRGQECKTAFKLKYKSRNIQFFIVTVRLCSVGGEMSVSKGLKELFSSAFSWGMHYCSTPEHEPGVNVSLHPWQNEGIQ